MTDRTEMAAFPADHYLAVATAYADTGAFDRAAAVARRGVADHPDDGRLWERLGVAAWAGDDWPTVVHALETAAYLVRLRPLAVLALADAHLGLGAIRPARRALRPLAEPGGCGPDLLPHVAGRLYRAADYKRAAKAWRRVLRARPISRAVGASNCMEGSRSNGTTRSAAPRRTSGGELRLRHRS